MSESPLILLAAGGTGGHLFPAEALGVALTARGWRVRLVTDERAVRYSGLFTPDKIDMVPSETIRSRNPLALMKTGWTLARGILAAWSLLGRLKPAAVVGFGGYPTFPPLVAARLKRVPTMVHDANAVMGRANRFLGEHVDAVAISFDGILNAFPVLDAKATVTGNPLRPAVIAAAAVPYGEPEAGGPLRILVTGGSQGARVMADVLPPAMALLDETLRNRIVLVQQVREEDRARVEAAYTKLKVNAELATFFGDLPARIAASHLVVSRSGATTVAELAAIGRPSILVPLPGAIDQDQFANAGVLVVREGAIRIAQAEFTPVRLAAEITALAGDPDRLSAMAKAARSAGRLDAAERLADLVMAVARRP